MSLLDAGSTLPTSVASPSADFSLVALLFHPVVCYRRTQLTCGSYIVSDVDRDQDSLRRRASSARIVKSARMSACHDVLLHRCHDHCLSVHAFRAAWKSKRSAACVLSCEPGQES